MLSSRRAARVAALYDIHGNLPALEAVLAEIDSAGIETIVCGGDIVAGPMPRKTLERLLALGDRVLYLRGNTDREVVSAFDGHTEMDGRRLGPFATSDITPELRDFLAQLPLTLQVQIEGLGAVLFCHATPRSDTEIVLDGDPDEVFAAALAGADAEVVVCGHTHMPFDRTAGSVRVVNPGSVGMPNVETGAHWAVLGPDVELRRTEYDLQGAADRIRATAWPLAREFADENVLAVPTAAQAYAAYRRMREAQAQAKP